MKNILFISFIAFALVSNAQSIEKPKKEKSSKKTSVEKSAKKPKEAKAKPSKVKAAKKPKEAKAGKKSSDSKFIDKLSIDANLGGRFGGSISDTAINEKSASLSPGLHFDGGIRYQVNKLISIRGGMSYDNFKTTWEGQDLSDSIDEASMLGGTIEAVVNLKELKFMSFIPKKIGLNLHAGFGLSTISNPAYQKDKIFTDAGIEGNDDVVTIVLGLTPQYQLNDKISINLDIAAKFLAKQSLYFNAGQDSRANETMGNIFNVAVGATYKF